LSAHLDKAIARIKLSMSKSLGAFAEIGRELKHINENELFLARYPTFMEFVHGEIGISWQKAYWFIRVHHRLEQLKAQLPGVEDLPSEESDMRLLDKVPDELLGAQWERVVRRARERGEGINMRFIKRVVEEENVVREYGDMEVAPAGSEATGILTDGGIQKVKIVNEANLYRLIFRSQSAAFSTHMEFVDYSA
jgi:hypothetical protein